MDVNHAASWVVPGLIAIAAFYAIHLIAHLESTIGDERPLTPVDLAIVHLNGLFVFGAAYWLIHAHTSTWTAPLALILAGWHGAIARSIWTHTREHALHFTAVAFTLLVFAIGIQFEGAWVIMGWAAEGAAIITLGLHTGRSWLRTGGLLLFGVALVRLLGLQLEPPLPGQLVLLNARAACGLFVIALTYALTWLHQRGLPGEATSAASVQRSREVTLFVVLAKLLILSFLTTEISAYWNEPVFSIHYVMAREALTAIAWASVGAAILWLGISQPRGWIRAVGGGVLLVAILRLIVLEMWPPTASYVVLVNARLLASAAIVALLYGLAARYRESASIDAAIHPRALLLLAANALTLMFLTSEIFAFWFVRDATYAGEIDAHLAREMMLSITWAAYATGLVVAGIRKQYAPIRYLAFVVFGVTIVKVFAVDLAELERIYRVTSIIALGITLLVTSYLYHRFRERLSESTP